MIISGLNRHLFSNAACRSIFTVIGPGNPHLKRNKIVVPLQQLNTDMGLYSFQVGLGKTNGTPGAPALAMSLSAQVSAETLGHKAGAHNPPKYGRASPRGRQRHRLHRNHIGMLHLRFGEKSTESTPKQDHSPDKELKPSNSSNMRPGVTNNSSDFQRV